MTSVFGSRARLRRLMSDLAGELVRAALPERCLVCGRFGAALHDECVPELPVAAPPRCPLCWAPGNSAECESCRAAPPAFDSLRAPFRFEGAARRAVLEAKFRGVTRLLPPLAAAAADTLPPAWRCDAVVPVPLHPRRRRRRGFNQAEIAAAVIATAIDAPLRPSLLRKTRVTPPQAGLGAAERARNVRGVFAAAGPAPARVLLVDDVTTTGATFHAAALALREAGATVVRALALARED